MCHPPRPKMTPFLLPFPKVFEMSVKHGSCQPFSRAHVTFLVKSLMSPAQVLLAAAHTLLRAPSALNLELLRRNRSAGRFLPSHCFAKQMLNKHCYYKFFLEHSCIHPGWLFFFFFFCYHCSLFSLGLHMGFSWRGFWYSKEQT